MSKKRRQNSKNPYAGVIAEPVVQKQDDGKLGIDSRGKFISDILDASISGGLNSAEISNFTNISNSRDQIYQLIDTMAKDSTVSAIIRTYAEAVCEVSDEGHVIQAESDDPKVSLFVNYILNSINADKNMFSWAYNLIKYGDVYLRLYRESDFDDPFFDAPDSRLSGKTSLNEQINVNVHKDGDKYSYYVEMVPDPSSMFELTSRGTSRGYIEVPNEVNTVNYLQNCMVTTDQSFANYQMKSGDVNIYQAGDFVHGCLEDNLTRFPDKIEIFNDNSVAGSKKSYFYTVRRGKSLLYDSYKIQREKALMEDAAILNRVTKSSVVRTVSIEVADMPKTQVQATLRRVKELMEQKSAINTGKGFVEYTNPGPVENNIYLATHNGQGAVTINSTGGDVEVKGLADLDWWNNKFYASYGVPKQFFGQTDDATGFNGGSSLSIISSVFAKGVKRIQNALVQMMTDALNLFLLDRNCTSYINAFTLKMRAPVTQEEIDYRAAVTNRISAVSNFQSLLSDVEDKGRKLRIMKTLIATLDMGEGIMDEIQAEIDAYEAEKAKMAEEGESEGVESDGENLPDMRDSGDVDLPPLGESFASDAEDLTPIEEDLNTTILDSLLTEDDKLPELDEIDVDLSKTN